MLPSLGGFARTLFLNENPPHLRVGSADARSPERYRRPAAAAAPQPARHPQLSPPAPVRGAAIMIPLRGGGEPQLLEVVHFPPFR